MSDTLRSARRSVLPGEPVQQAKVRNAEVHAPAQWLEPLVQVVRDHGSLYEWAATQPQPRALRGRAPVYVAQLPDRHTSVVVRHAWHGGLLAPLTQDVFRRPTRAPLEMARSRELHAAGIPTTELLGYALYDAALGLVRVDVVTRYVTDTADLGMVLAGLTPDIECEAAFTATLDLLVLLAEHRVVHPDLNVKNILLHTPRTAAPRAMVIDVDVVVIGAASPVVTMQRNVARLTRSLRKWNRQFGCDLADQRIAAFAAAALARVGASAPSPDAGAA